MKFPVSDNIRAVASIIDFKNQHSILKFYQEAHIESTLLKAEKRLLLHPVLDNPLKHLSFHADGTVTGITKEGKESIKVYGLNDEEKRIDLIIDRKQVINDIKKDIRKAVLRYQNTKNEQTLYDDLLDIHVDIEMDISVGTKPFIAVRDACLVNFASFFIEDYIGSRYETLLNTIFSQIESDIKSAN